MPQMMRPIVPSTALKTCQTKSQTARHRTRQSGTSWGIKVSFTQNCLWLSISNVTGPSLTSSTSM